MNMQIPYWGPFLCLFLLLFACSPEAPPKNVPTDSSPSSPAVTPVTPSSSEDPSLTPASQTPSSPTQTQNSDGDSTCLSGSEGCVCYPNGSCDPKDGIPMACIDQRCQAGDFALAGTLGGLCDADTSCTPFQGQALSCINGQCGLDSCPSGQTGCPCLASGRCLGTRDQRTMCQDRFCVPFACTPGSKSCVCAEGQCQDGLSCDLNVCRQVSSFIIRVEGSPDLRACDVLMEVDEGGVQMRLHDQVIAKKSRRGRKIGISMISKIQNQIANQPVQLVLDRPESISPDSERLVIVEATCYDKLGHPDPRTRVSIR